MMAVVSLIATEKPNWSPAAPSSARSLKSWTGLAGSEMSKRYAEPDSGPLSSSRLAPTIAVAPPIATDTPNQSSAAPSSARSLAS